MIGERGSTTGAIGYHLVTLIEQIFIPDLLQNPPDRFDILVMQSDVGIIHVDPITDFVSELFPFTYVLEDARTAFLVEGGDAVFLDGLLAREAKLPLHFQFDREAVSVPAPFAPHVPPLHRVVTWECIFHRSRDGMPDVRFPVRCRRSLVEYPRFAILPMLDGAHEDIVFFPEL